MLAVYYIVVNSRTSMFAVVRWTCLTPGGCVRRCTGRDPDPVSGGVGEVETEREGTWGSEGWVGGWVAGVWGVCVWGGGGAILMLHNGWDEGLY